MVTKRHFVRFMLFTQKKFKNLFIYLFITYFVNKCATYGFLKAVRLC